MSRSILILLMQSSIGVVGQLPAPSAPVELDVQLRTAGDATVFQLSEIVPLEVAFRTSKPSTYSIEIADGWNAAPTTDRFLVQPVHDVIDRNARLVRGIACCDSRRAFLTSTPAVYAHELTDYLRFVQPGEYRIQYETRRVFEASPIRGFEPSDLLVRSNIIRIKIIEDDPRWLEGTLAASLAVVDAPPPLSELLALPRLPMQGSLQAPILGEALVRYRRAAQQLRMLDTPEAIRARVARIQLPSADQWRTLEAKQVAYQGVDTSVLHSSRPDLVAAALRERAAEPGFGVMRGYFELWVNVLIERDHPELVRLTRTRALREQETERELRMPVIRELLDTMRELNGSKTGLAAEITGATLRWVERDLERR